MSGYRLTPRAEEGLLRVVNHIDRSFGEAVTDDVLAAIEKALSNLAAMPSSGHVRPDLTTDDSIRFWAVGPTLIAYRPGDRCIEVLFIERGEMDWEAVLGGLL